MRTFLTLKPAEIALVNSHRDEARTAADKNKLIVKEKFSS
jgi:hypothetical protein